MTGRERFEALIDGRKPDRLPIYFTAIACSVASEILGREAHTGADSLHFKEELALYQGEEAHREFEEKHIEDVSELWRKLGVDVVRETWRSRMKPAKRIDEYTLLFGDENGAHLVKRFYPVTQTYGTICITYTRLHPDELAHRLEEDLEKAPELHFTSEQAAAALRSPGLLFDRMERDDVGRMVTGMDAGFPFYDPTWLELSALRPELIARYTLRAAKQACEHIRQIAAQKYRWFSGGGDIAGNTGPMISPRSFREIMVPPLKMIADACEALQVVYCYRSDGNLWPIFDDLFGATGIQAYGEVDRDAGMAVGMIRARNPKLIVLGNTSSSLLAQGTEAQIQEDTRRQLEEAQGVGFIPGPSNAVVHGTPVRNIYAMLEVLQKK